MGPDVIYKHAMVIWDRDDKQSLGGKNIQVGVGSSLCRPWFLFYPFVASGQMVPFPEHVASVGECMRTAITALPNIHPFPEPKTRQEFLEELQKEDPVTHMPQVQTDTHTYIARSMHACMPRLCTSLVLVCLFRFASPSIFSWALHLFMGACPLPTNPTESVHTCQSTTHTCKHTHTHPHTPLHKIGLCHGRPRLRPLAGAGLRAQVPVCAARVCVYMCVHMCVYVGG